MTTYEFPGKEDVRITVGDEKQQDFFPRMKIKRWDNEVNFSVGIISTSQGSHDMVSDKVEWNDGHGIGAKFYQKPGEEFEFEIVLDKKPAAGFVLLSIESKGLRFLYQPELTEEESAIDPETGHPECTRPDDVVGSYAVYHASMKGNYPNGKNYRTGKAFHIYRPFVTDANGKREWCVLDITGSVMKITIPNGLVYPVVVDPTFGVDPASPGGSWTGWATAECGGSFPGTEPIRGSLFTSPANADKAESITMYVKQDTMAGPFNVKGVVVLHSNLEIIANGVGTATGVNTESGGWVTSDLASDPTISASTEYVLMGIPSMHDTNMAYDVGATDQGHCEAPNEYDSPVNLTNPGHSTKECSIYCTYIARAAPTSVFIGPFGGPFGGPIQ